MSGTQREYVVTTFYKRDSRADTRPVTHTFGPYTKASALRLRDRFIEDSVQRDTKEMWFHCSVNKLLFGEHPA